MAFHLTQFPVQAIGPLAAFGISVGSQLLGNAIQGSGGKPHFVTTDFFSGFPGINSPIGQMGLHNLYNVLARAGQTDPRLFNRQVVGARRGAEANARAIEQAFARAGLQNFAGGIAAQGAARAAGESQVGDIRAREAFISEERVRNDLVNLLGGLIINPALQTSLAASGLTAPAAQIGQTNQQNMLAMLGQLAQLGALSGNSPTGQGGGVWGAPVAFGSCWVAAELYGGWHHPDTERVRSWMLHEAPEQTRRLYMQYGPMLAEMVRRSPRLRRLLKPVFDRIGGRHG